MSMKTDHVLEHFPSIVLRVGNFKRTLVKLKLSRGRAVDNNNGFRISVAVPTNTTYSKSVHHICYCDLRDSYTL